MSINIRPGVLGFTSSEEDIRNKFVDLSHQLEERVIREMFQRELALSRVPRVLDDVITFIDVKHCLVE